MQSVRLKRAGAVRHLLEARDFSRVRLHNGSCKGLMQINIIFQKDRMKRIGVSDLYDQYSNILVGADYLAELFDKYEDQYLVLMVYNMGYRKAISLYNNEQYTNYAVEICERSEELERIHGK